MPLLPEHPGQRASADLVERRAGLGAAITAGLWRTDPPPGEERLDGVRVLRLDPPGPAHGTLVHLHGGAFRIGCPEQVAPFAAALAARCGISVICPAYRLAPEHPFPAGLNDARKVLAVLAGKGPQPLILSGDSAGGGLATSLASDEGRWLAGLVLLSPWLDLTVTAPSYLSNAASDPLFSAGSAREAATLYLQGQSAENPLASPLFARTSYFPPTLIHVGDGEVLLDDAQALHSRLRERGVASYLDVIAGMDHVAVTRDRSLPGAAESFERLAMFIDGILAPASSTCPRDG